MKIFGKPIVKRQALFRTSGLHAREIPPASFRNTTRRELVGVIPYNSRSVNLGGYEVILPGAFREALKKGVDVKCLFAHDIARPLGRVKNGSLLLKDTQAGLECRVILPQTTYADDLYNLVKRGDVSALSFGFNNAKTRTKIEAGETVNYLEQVDLLEISMGVIFPAYEESNTEARKIEQGALARYLSSLPTEEIIRLHSIFVSPSSLREGHDQDVKNFLKGLHEASKGA